MKTSLLSAIAAAAFVAGAAMAQAPQGGGQPAHAARMMKTETRADVQAHVAKMFARFDTNGDGFVTKAELDAKQARRAQKESDRAERRAARFDPAQMFARLDANKDGQITRAEAEAAHNARIQAKGGEPAKAHAVAFGGLFDRADTNKDGAITKAEFDATAAQMHARMDRAGMHRGMGGRMFEMGDVNKDGRVSLAEAQQVALQHFGRADANHDGKLTPEERKQAHQLLRGDRHPS